MFYLNNVLEFVIHSLDEGSFSGQQTVRDGYHRTFHVAREFSNELYAIHEELLKRRLADIAFVTDRLPEYKTLQSSCIPTAFGHPRLPA